MVLILSNINIDPIGMNFPKNEYVLGGFGQHELAFLDESSKAYDENIKSIFIYLDGDELIKKFRYDLPSKDIFEIVSSQLNQYISILTNFLSKRPEVVLVINNLCFSPDWFCTYFSNSDRYDFSLIESQLNQILAIFCQQRKNILLLDWVRLVKKHGYQQLTDPKFWYLGRIKLNTKAFSILASEYSSLMGTYRGKIKKVLILDLDNTLWGGVIGEDGLGKIKLSEDDIGKAYRDFQAIIKSLKQLGILLCINSKNNLDDAKEVFDQHAMMILDWDDFIIKKINWTNKSVNLQELAQELNLGLDSFVFIDDNPVERQIVSDNLPQVVVPDFPDDPSLIPLWFYEEVVYKHFTKFCLTKEDTKKDDQYKANIFRKELSQNISIDKFIESLEIKTTLYVNSSQHLQRLAQMTQKTNQFNLTTRRYTDNDIDRFIKQEDAIVFALDYEDKYGQEGIVCLAILKLEKDKALIDTFLMSCRVIGRTIEFLFLYKILKAIKEKKIDTVVAEFIPTKKNVVAKDFYSSAGFEQGSDGRCPSAIDPLLTKLEQYALTTDQQDD